LGASPTNGILTERNKNFAKNKENRTRIDPILLAGKTVSFTRSFKKNKRDALLKKKLMK